MSEDSPYPKVVLVPRDYEAAVREEMEALRVVYEPPYEDLERLIFHAANCCVHCDALRRLAGEATP